MDIPNFLNMTSSEIIRAGHSFFAKPSLVMMWIIGFLAIAIPLFALTDKEKTNVGKLFLILGVYVLISGLGFLFLFLSPNAVQGIASLFN